MQSTNDPRLLIGLGAVKEVAKVTIRWPSGTLSIREHLTPNKTYEVIEPPDKNP
jgi:enediyne biosynthesis protein E4